MVNLDALLVRWNGSEPWKKSRSDWSGQDARELADVLSDEGLENVWDPVAEEFITLVGGGEDRALRAMISIFFPLAILDVKVPTVPRGPRSPEIVRVQGLHTAELSADPALLRATLLRSGWIDPDFDPTCFSGWDLFVESS